MNAAFLPGRWTDASGCAAPLDLDIQGQGIYSWKGPPTFGRQDQGYSPGGVQDRFSYRTGLILLDLHDGSPVLEMVVPPRAIRFLDDCALVVTGGACVMTLRQPGDSEFRPVEHGCVHTVTAGSVIRFGRRLYGFRTYLACSAGFRQPGPSRRCRGEFSAIAGWPHRDGCIRVLAGPEYTCLGDPEGFLRTSWVTTGDLSGMGIRLDPRNPGDGGVPTWYLGNDQQMASGPVCDGTVQITPSGPIVLMRDRQTTGGYPRAFIVINADVDRLAQIGPCQMVRFRLVTLDEADRVNSVYHADLERLAERFARCYPSSAGAGETGSTPVNL